MSRRPSYKKHEPWVLAFAGVGLALYGMLFLYAWSGALVELLFKK